MQEQINNHMSFILEGEILPETAEQYEKTALLGKVIRISGRLDEEETLIGFGMVTEAEIYAAGGRFDIVIKGHSVDYKMAKEKRRRSWQKTGYTYWDIFSCLAVEQVKVRACDYRRERLKAPVIQYDETDWELLQRLAGDFHTVLISDVYSRTGGVFFGPGNETVHSLGYSSRFQISVQRREDGKGRICYTFQHRIDMRLGDTVILDNVKWMVIRKKITYRNAVCETEYMLGQMQDWQLPSAINSNLRGTTIRGTVLRCDKERVKLWMHIDEEQTESDTFWFPYLPETGNLMYAMPEEGAEVALYFPDGKERNGIVTRCYWRKDQNSGRWNRMTKSIETPFDKKIRFWPNTIEITGESETEINELFLGEGTGVQCNSKKPIHIIADGSVIIQSGLSCSVTAGSRIGLWQTGGRNRIEMYGNLITSAAEKYVTLSARHKSKNAGLDNKKRGQTFPSLHDSFLGMIAQGDAGDINNKILAGIPVIGGLKGKVSIQNNTGLRVRRNHL